MKKYLIAGAVFAVLVFAYAGTVSAAPISSLYRSLIPEATDQYYIGTSTPSTVEWNGIYTKDITISGTCTGCSSGSFDPFSHTTNYGQTASATSTAVWFQASPYSLFASSTSVFEWATTTKGFTNDGATWLTSLTAPQLVYVGTGGKLNSVATSSTGTANTVLFLDSSTHTTIPFASTTAVTASSIYDTGITSGQIVYAGGSNSLLKGVATTTPTCSGLISCPNLTTITNAGGATTFSATYDAWTHGQVTNSATTSALGIGTTTPFSQLSVSTSTQSSALTPLFGVASTTNATLFNVLGGGFVGVGTTSPYGSFTINTTAGIDPFAIGSTTGNYFKIDKLGRMTIGTTTAGTLNTTSAGLVYVGSAAAGTVTSVATGVGLAGGPITTSGTLTNPFAIATTSVPSLSVGNLAFFSGTSPTKIGGVSTTSISCTGIASCSNLVTITSAAGATTLSASYDAWTHGQVTNSATTSALGIGTTTPFSQLSVSTSTQSAATTPLFAVASTTNTTLFNVLGGGNVGVSSTSPQKLFSIGNALAGFFVDSLGKIFGCDTANSWCGRITPTRIIPVGAATSTTWTATTSNAYAFATAVTLPFTGTIKNIQCTASSTGAFLGVEPFINQTATTPKYFVASTTVGTITLTAGNTFNKGDSLLIYVGTSTAHSALGVNCNFFVTENP